MNYGGNVKLGVLCRRGVKPGVVPERSLGNEGFVGVYIPLEDYFGVGGVLYIDSNPLYQFHRLFPNDAGE